MTSESPVPKPAPPMQPARALLTIFCAGISAGVLDIGYAFLFFTSEKVGPVRILRGIAAGLLGGKRVAAGGNEMAVLGLGLHFVIATGAAAVFFLFSRKLTILVRQPVISGLVFGALVFLVMNLAVLPLSATPPKAFPPRNWESLLVAHLLCVGLPIAVVTWGFSRNRTMVAASS